LSCLEVDSIPSFGRLLDGFFVVADAVKIAAILGFLQEG
jgi:hypothetical protein